MYAAEIPIALGKWSATHRVGFTINDSTPDIRFINDCATDPLFWYAQTTGTNPYLIKLNRMYMDGHPLDNCASYYPPRPNIHHVVSTIAHEVGHALRIAHNTSDRSALMWPGVDSYFVCGTEDVTSDETTRLAALYPTLCGQ